MNEERRRRLYEIVEVGAGEDTLSRFYDFFSVGIILINLLSTMFSTFDYMELHYGHLLNIVEFVTVVFFTIDYVLRFYTAKYAYPGRSERESVRKYATSFTGIIDLFSFLPYYMPFFFPAGLSVFRMLRVVRIFRLFRVNAYYDALNVITEVLNKKKQQLISSVFIILVLMLASSLCMYSLEHEAQPEVFRNAFSGMWWSVSTLLTVGYGDIYPITVLGRILGIVITFLGVGMVAIPTGIISAGFVEQYSEIKVRGDIIDEADVRFVRAHLSEGDPWIGLRIQDLRLPGGLLVAAIRRGGRTIVPRGDVTFEKDDTAVLAAEPFTDDEHVDIKTFSLNPHHSWVGTRVRDLDISRQSLIIMVRRGSEVIIPNGDLVFEAGDKVFMYTESRITNTKKYEF